MTEKYYIPSLEEFHIGFKYEEKILGRWGEVEYEPDDTCLVGDIIYDIDNETVRIKYLDKEDIESLGWKFFNICYHKFGKGDKYNLFYSGLNNGIDEFCITESIEGKSPKTLFDGKVKNKSELKRLMIQLSIT